MKHTIKFNPYDIEATEMARFAKALGHPVRIEILRFLESQACCFTGEIVEVFPLAQSTISQHLKELKEAGLIQGEVNPPKVKYCIDQVNWHKAQKLFNEFFNQMSDVSRACST
jgi:ArsR family transcriptional regulator, arsenate/arsenite/antimonite-responsive transcriptional repressor